MDFRRRYHHSHDSVAPSQVIDSLIERTRQDILPWRRVNSYEFSCEVDGGSVRVAKYGTVFPRVRVLDANSLPAMVSFPCLRRAKLRTEIVHFINRTLKAYDQSVHDQIVDSSGQHAQLLRGLASAPVAASLPPGR